MAQGRRDVSLVVRARDDATKAFENVAKALSDLIAANGRVGASAEKTGGQLAALTAFAVQFDKAYAKIAASADQAGAAFARQEGRIAEQRAGLSALKGQAEATARALRALESSLVDRGLAGDTEGQAKLREQIRATQTEQERLAAQIAKTTAAIQADETALDGMRSALQQAGSLANAAAAAQDDLAQAIRRAGAAQQAQNQAAQVLARVERTTGVTRDRGDMDQLIAQLKAESVAHEKIQEKLAAESDLRRENLTLAEAEAAAARLQAAQKPVRAVDVGIDPADTASVEAFERQMRESAAATRDLDAAARRLRNEIDPLAAIQERLNGELAEANGLYRAGRISAQELAKAEELLRDRAAKAQAALAGDTRRGGKPTLFGLKPYEVQNLGFQINDVVTQLASGASVTQTLAQQGGQILQIFPKAGAAIVAALSNPAILAAAATLGTMVAALREAGREQAQLRSFQGTLTATADAAAYQAQALSDSASAIDKFGVSAQAATAIVRVFVKEGVNPDQIVAFGRAAKDMADVLGIDATDAAGQLSEAFTGGYAAVKKLDDSLNFLTAAEREHIRVLFEEGRAQEARRLAFEKFADRYDQAAQQMRGPWTEAVHSLANAWDAFIRFLGQNPAIQKWAADLNAVANAVTVLLNKLSGSGARPLAEVDRDLAATTQRINAINREIETSGDSPARSRELREQLKALGELNAERARLFDSSGSDTRATQTEREAKATQDLARATDELAAKNKTLTAAQRIAAAAKKAGDEADRRLDTDEFKAASDLQKAEYRRLAVAQARREEEKKISDELAAQRRETDRIIKAFAQKVPGVESGGRDDAQPKNADGSLRSSALGQGQFLEQTWLDLFRKHFPEEAQRLGRDAILELRKDAQTTKQMIEVYARDNAEVLQKAGQSVTEANLYLAHFLGPAGAVKVLQAKANTAVSKLLSAATIDANPEALRGKTAGQVVAFANRKFGDSEASKADAALTTRLAEIEQQRLEKQAQFDQKLKSEVESRVAETKALQAQAGLQGAALVAEAKKQFIAEQVLRKQQEIDRINADRVAKGLPGELAFTEAQRKEVEKTAAAWFDVAHARELAAAQTDDAERQMRDLQALADAQRELIESLRANGDFSLANSLLPDLDATNAKLRDATDKAIAFYRALDPATDPLHRTQEQIDAIIARLEAGKVAAQSWGTVFGLQGEQVAQSIAGNLSSAWDDFAKRIADGQKVTTAFFDSFRQGAANFLLQIAQMIEQQLAFNAAQGILSAFGVQTPQSGAGLLSSTAGPRGRGKSTLAGFGDFVSGFGFDAPGGGGLTLPGTSSGGDDPFGIAQAFATDGGSFLSGFQGVFETNTSGGFLGALGGIFQSLMSGAGSFLQNIGGGLLAAFGFHEGGVAGGRPTFTRMVSPATFANAVRYHEGGIAGLRPGEIPAILKRGEVVDPGDGSVAGRVFGGGGLSMDALVAALKAAMPDIKVVNTLDSGSFVSAGLDTPEGTRAIMNLMRANSTGIRQILGTT